MTARTTKYALFGAASILAYSGFGAKTYLMEESTDFTGNGCENGDVNTITSTLRTSMDNDGWSGSRYVNSSSWPQDLMESCSSNYGSGGLDSTYGDTKSLAVFAGHGNAGLLAFGYKRDNRCTVDFSSNMRLGSMDGNLAAVGMWLGCNALQVDTLVQEANWQWLRQQLGWNNTIGIGDNEPRDFYNATDTKTNARAWLDQMDGSGREPVVVSYGSTESGCWSVHNSATLHDNVYTSSRSGAPSCNQGQPLFWYCYEWIDL